MNWCRTFDGRVIDVDGTGPVDDPDPGDALIYLDLETIRPVFEGRWHRPRPDRFPGIGERLTMLCGLAKTVSFADVADRTAQGVPTCCPDCDLIYRAQHGIEIRIARSC